MYVFGLMILYKIRGIRRDLTTVKTSLKIVARKIGQDLEGLDAPHDHRNINGNNTIFNHQPEAENHSNKEPSENRSQSTKIAKDNKKRITEESPDIGKTPPLDKEIDSSQVKTKILNLLKKNSRPISYHEIAESLSQDFREHDFNSILKELDQLEKKGDIIGQVAAGKLYFQIKR